MKPSDHRVADKMVFDDGERRVELFKQGPAHTRGDADVDADHRNWVRVLDQLTRWDVKVVAPAHGVLGTLDTIRGQRDYLADMLKQVEAGIKAGKTVDQVALGAQSRAARRAR